MNRTIFSVLSIIIVLMFFHLAHGADYHQMTFSKPNPEAQPHWAKGLASFKKSDYSPAVLELTQYIELTPTSTMARLLRGHTYYKQGNYNDAIADFNKVLEIQNGNEYFSYANLATVYLEEKDYDNAWKMIHKAEETLDQVNEEGALNFVLIKSHKELIEELRTASGRSI